MIHEPTWRPGGPNESNYIASCPCGWRTGIASNTSESAKRSVAEHRTYPETRVTLTVEVPVIDSPIFELALRKALIDRSGEDQWGPMPMDRLVAECLAYGVNISDVARTIRGPHLFGPYYDTVEVTADA